MKNKVVYEKEWGMYGNCKFYMYRNVLVNFFVYVNIYFCYKNDIIVYVCVWYVYNVYVMYNN